MPKPACWISESALVAMPPLWATIEIPPGRSASISRSAVENVGVAGKVALMTPTQFGPHRMKPVSRHRATSARWSSAPAPPASPRPPA